MSHKFGSNCLEFSTVLLFLLLFQSFQGLAQFAEVDAIAERSKSQYGGQMVVLAWKNDTILYKKEIGDLNINSAEEVGAAGNWFTAALVMHYVDQGKISLDDPVSDYLPIFAKYAKSYLTIRHCLTHTTGMQPEKGRLQKLLQKSKFPTLEDEVNSFAKLEIITNPGEEFYYSNIGINIAGRVLEVVGKKGFDRLMQEKIFRPLGMKKSTYTSEFSVNPSGGARTSALDYMKFLGMLINKGTFNGKQILSEEAVTELLSIQAKEVKRTFVPEVAQSFAYALGSFVQETDGKGNPVVFSSPGLTGTWPYLDMCRKYACIVFVKPQSKEDKKDLYVQIKSELDRIAGACDD
jgi:CubicO group peptidase (beta-lactamase class C family)